MAKITRKSKRKSNPNKANQWRPDPRQSLFLQFYLDPKSETFANCLRSALKANYSEEYAKVLVAQMPTWLSENLKDGEMISQAEKNLLEFLIMDTINTGQTKKGEIFEYDDAGLKRIKADISKFVLERLHKRKWSERKELTGSEGRDLIELDEKKFRNIARREAGLSQKGGQR